MPSRRPAPRTQLPRPRPLTSGVRTPRLLRSGLRYPTAGLKVINLRVPLALGKSALNGVPGLSEATSDRIKEAIQAGIKGPTSTSTTTVVASAW